MPHRPLTHILAAADTLPSLPSAVTRLLSALADERMGMDALAHHVEADPALVARVLAAANAGSYGSSKVETVPQAMGLLGLNRVREIALSNVMLEVFAADMPPSLGSMWLESLAAAICADEIAQRVGENPATAYVAGLLHDIGKLLLYAVFRNDYLAVLVEAEQGGHSVSQLEREALQVDHAEVGHALALHWQMPQSIADAILGHTASPAEHVVRSRMGSIVHVGVTLAYALDLGGRCQACVPLLDDSELLGLGLHWSDLPAMFARIEGRFMAVRELLGYCTQRCGPSGCSGMCKAHPLPDATASVIPPDFSPLDSSLSDRQEMAHG